MYLHRLIIFSPLRWFSDQLILFFIVSNLLFCINFVDIAISHFSGGINDFTTFDDQLSSDHRPIQCIINIGISSHRNFIHDYKWANWRRFQQYILEHQNQSPIDNRADIDLAIEHGTKTIIEARDISVPRIFLNQHRQRIKTPSKTDIV